MKNFIRASRHSLTPKVCLDAQSGICIVSGKSLIDDPYIFYQAIFDWVDEYMAMEHTRLFWFIRLDYLCIGSKKMLLRLLKKLKEYNQTEDRISICWVTPLKDTDLINEIEELTLFSDMPIRLSFATCA